MKKLWRVATQKLGTPDRTWDVGKTPMTASNARSVARQLNIVYPEYRHKAIKVKS